MEETLLLDLIRNARTGAPAVIIPTEAERTRIATRLLAGLMRTPTTSAGSIPLRKADWDALAEAAERLSKSRIYFETVESR